MKILVCIKDDTERSDAEKMIKAEFPQVEMDLAADGQQGIDFITQDQSYGTVIAEFELEHKNGGEIYRFTQMQMLDMPFILISEIELRDDENVKDLLKNSSANSHILKPLSQEVLKEKLRKAFGSDLELNDEPVEGFSAVEIEKFNKIKTIPCDVYIKLKQSGKMIKILHEQTVGFNETIEKYKQKSLKKLYVKTEHMPRLEEML